MSDRPEEEDICKRLMAACHGFPAKISWPHRLLHDASDEIKRLRSDLATAKDREKEAFEGGWLAYYLASNSHFPASGGDQRDRAWKFYEDAKEEA